MQRQTEESAAGLSIISSAEEKWKTLLSQYDPQDEATGRFKKMMGMPGVDAPVGEGGSGDADGGAGGDGQETLVPTDASSVSADKRVCVCAARVHTRPIMRSGHIDRTIGTSIHSSTCRDAFPTRYRPRLCIVQSTNAVTEKVMIGADSLGTD
ncbi:unnamed protein product [Sphagnum balticum]